MSERGRNFYKRLRRAAEQTVQNDIRKGKLEKGYTCEMCGEEDTSKIKGKHKIEAHHPDYMQFHFVIWLCHYCHYLSHRLEKQAKIGLVFDYYSSIEPCDRTIKGKHILGYRPRSEFKQAS